MKTIGILIFRNTPLSSVSLPMDIFQSTGVLWNILMDKPVENLFDVKVITVDGEPVVCSGGVKIYPHCSIVEANDLDVLIVAPMIGEDMSGKYKALVLPWLKELNSKGIFIASVCSAAFVLAEAGLLNGKVATTHWGQEERFKKQFPEVELKISATVTEDDKMLCSGGANAGADLALHLIRKFYSSEIAYQTAKALLLDPRRELQSPYSTFNFNKSHGDSFIVSVQVWIEENYMKTFFINELAKEFGVGRRTLERRFKAATGDPPLLYTQKVRVEAAKLMLEIKNNSFEDITMMVGYEDASTFRKVFIKQTGITPGQYKNKFKR